MASMASPAPAKSQPLHNFSLPHHLTWKKNHSTSRTRLSTPPPPPPPSNSSPLDAPRRQSSPSYVPRRHSPLLDSLSRKSPLRESESESDFRRHRSPSYASRRQPSPAGKHSPFLDSSTTKQSPMRDSESESDPTPNPNPKFVLATEKGKRSKISIRFRKNKQDEATTEDGPEKSTIASAGAESSAAAAAASAEDEESLLPKTWNLRPRRPLNKQSNGGEVLKNGGLLLQENKGVEKVCELGGNKSVEKKEKRREFSIALSRHEIEEDLYALTGSKPSRRPKKRHKTVQRTLDALFPGLWLGTITADTYKISEAPTKM